MWKKTLSLLCLSALCAAPAQALVSLQSVNVMADHTISLAVAELARDYSRRHEIVVNTSFLPAKLQEAQIAEGAAADILITPQRSWIESLKTKGLVDVYSEMPVAQARLALAGPADSPIDAQPSKGFPAAALVKQMAGEPGFVVANPETLPEGGYSKEALRNLGASDDLEPYTLYIKSQDQMLDMVMHRQAYGLFLYSAIVNRPGMRLIEVLPDSSHKPMRYFAVVVAGDNMNEARKFLDYLQSPEARQLFRENGLAVD